MLDDPDFSLVKALQTAQQNFVITDPTLPDNPIVFASQGFLELTGYTLDQVTPACGRKYKNYMYHIILWRNDICMILILCLPSGCF